MTLVRYRNGLKLDGMYCSFCDARRTGTIFREKLRWMARLECGHLSFKGWIKPPEELEREGLLNEQLKEQEINKKTYTEDAERRAIVEAERALWRAEKRGSLDHDLKRWHDRTR